MNLKELITNYLEKQYMMQLATVDNSQPWICTVYYVVDDNLNFYWLSIPTRRHSKELNHHDKVAAAIPVNFVKGEKVIGLQTEGIAEELPSNESAREIAIKYADKFSRTEKWVNDFCSNNTDHKLYKLSPSLFVLFDEENFPDQPRQEIKIN